MKYINKVLCIFVSILFVVCSMAGCFTRPDNKEQENNMINIIDLSSRSVKVKNPCKRVVAIGPGALRLYCYIGRSDSIVGIEQIEKDNESGRPYILANPEIKKLDMIGAGGPNNAPDPEKILSVNPDVIFSTYADQNELQSKTGIPVISLSYGNTAVFDEDLYKSLEIIGKVIGNEDRASDVINYIKDCKTDLKNRTNGISDSNKPCVYTGAMSMKGAHGIESTEGNNPLYNALNAKNVVDETGKTGSIMIDKEKLIEWNPDIIFIDSGGMSLVKNDYSENKDFYTSLKAFENNNVYLLQPYNHYTTNIDTAITDAYYMGTVIYPDKFKDVNPKDKADEIYNFLLGKKLYNDMSRDFGEFDKIEIK